MIMRNARLTRRNELFNRVCRHSVLIAKKSGINSAAEDTWGDPIAYKALVEMEPHMILDTMGTERLSSGWALLAFPPPDVNIDDQITLPDGTQPPIRKVDYDVASPPVLPTIVHF